MTTWKKAAVGISLSLMLLFCCVGYAAVTENMSVSGSIEAEAPPYDVYITSITPSQSAGISVTGHFGTIMTAKVTGGGTASFTVTVKNTSEKIYVYERVVDGEEVGLDGVYSEGNITYQVTGISRFDELDPLGGSRTFRVDVTVPQGVSTELFVLNFKFIEKSGMEILPDDYVDVTFKLNNNQPDVVTKVVRNRVIPRPEPPTRYGYVFAGWYTDAECTSAWYFDVDKVTDNITLYAKWEQSRYTVEFEPNNGEPRFKTTVLSGSLLGLPAAPEKSGYTFIGWYTDAECKAEDAWNFDTDKPVSDMLLYAGWEEYKEPVKPYLYITFHPYPGSANDTGAYTVEILTGSFVPRQGTPENPGFVFVGWYTDTSYTTAWNFEASKPEDDMHLYAGWRKVESYTVTFKPGNNTPDTSITVEEGELVPIPEQPTLENYVFVGWYADSAYTTVWNFYADKPSSDMSLYAKWEKASNAVNADIAGLAQAFLNKNLTNSLNNSDEIYDKAKEVKPPSNAPNHAPVVHCKIPTVAGGTLGSFTENANKGLSEMVEFIVMVDPNNPERLFVYMYYAADCTQSAAGTEIETYLQAYAYDLDERGNKVWYADGTYKGTAVVGYFATGQNKQNNKRAWMVDAYSWKAVAVTAEENAE